jgi:hypothetical protein
MTSSLKAEALAAAAAAAVVSDSHNSHQQGERNWIATIDSYDSYDSYDRCDLVSQDAPPGGAKIVAETACHCQTVTVIPPVAPMQHTDVSCPR